jgi:hypothetical protein
MAFGSATGLLSAARAEDMRHADTATAAKSFGRSLRGDFLESLMEDFLLLFERGQMTPVRFAMSFG